MNTSPFRKANDEILFIPCINCNQLIKINEIEHHSEICVSYSENIENTNNNVKINNNFHGDKSDREKLHSEDKFNIINYENSCASKIFKNKQFLF